jgi:hypothetical protein
MLTVLFNYSISTLAMVVPQKEISLVAGFVQAFEDFSNRLVWYG